MGNDKKRKWLLALNVKPVDVGKVTDLGQTTTDETASPYPSSMLGSRPSSIHAETRPAQFFFDTGSENSVERVNGSERGPRKKPKVEFDQSECWFCLSNPTVSKHLVISVGTRAYLALARGGLVKDHFLIVPVEHRQSLAVLPDDVAGEMKTYRDAVAKYYADTDRAAIFYERNYKNSHCQLQAVPIPKNRVSSLHKIFLETAKSDDFELEEIPRYSRLAQIAPAGIPYFYVELPDGEMLYHRIGKSFPLQFGRRVLSSEAVLNVPHRADWRECRRDENQETEVATKIRDRFKPFDPDT